MTHAMVKSNTRNSTKCSKINPIGKSNDMPYLAIIQCQYALFQNLKFPLKIKMPLQLVIMRSQTGSQKEDSSEYFKKKTIYEDKVYENVDIGGTQKVLDVGCGNGIQSLVMLRRFPEISLIGVDNCQNQIYSARENLKKSKMNPKRCQFKFMDGESLKFEPKEFDRVSMMTVLGFCHQPLQVLKESYRVLKQGGKLIVTQPLYHASKIHPLCHYFQKYQQQCLGYMSKHGDPDIGIKLYNMMHESGFKNVKTRMIGFHSGNKSAEEFEKLVNFEFGGWLICADVLVREGLMRQEQIQFIENERKRVLEMEDSSIIFCMIQLQGTVE